MKRGRVAVLVRVLSLLRLFESKGRYRADALAVRFGVNVRTIYRDLDALQQAGYPLVYQPKGHDGQGYWWMA